MRETLERRKEREYDPIKFIDAIAAVSRRDGKMPDPEAGIGRECYAFSEQEDKAFEVAEKTAQEILHGFKEGQDYRIEKDGIGNMYIRFLCGMRGVPAIMVGSHLDSVLEGGKYDGVAGVAAGLEALAEVIQRKKNGERFVRDLVVAAFRSEESSPRNGAACVGSAAATGQIEAKKLGSLMYDSKQNIAFRDHFVKRYGAERYGQLVHELSHPVIRKEDYAAYLEAHIEQSGVIAARDKDIGIVVEGIGGARRDKIGTALEPEKIEAAEGAYRKITLTFHGVSDHTGGTPPNPAFYDNPDVVWYRKDALVAACNAVNKLLGHPLNGTGIKVLRSGPAVETGFTSVPSHQITELLVPVAEMEDVRSRLETLKAETAEKMGVGMEYQDEEFPAQTAKVVDSKQVRKLLNLPEIASVLSTKAFNKQGTETGTTRATVTDYVLSPEDIGYKLDLREVNERDLKELIDAIHARTDLTLGEGTYTTIQVKVHAPVDEGMARHLQAYAEELGISFVLMPSAPGHDADRMAALGIPTAMVFIRQDDGISHNPREKMKTEDFHKGAMVWRNLVLAKLKQA